MPEIVVEELEPTRLEVVVDPDGERSRHHVVMPAGVGVPGATDEELVEALVRALLERGAPVPRAFDVPTVLRAHPDLWPELERRLGG